ncbi:MAG: carboxypeptidase-like regulatory domain-containing protein [Chlorobi bacterium]|nr:carboxypeptidase-like regulatory domain-containing protein [Chlorobiota bacterium]
MKFKFLLLLLVALFNGKISNSAVISGTITDETGTPLPFASVFIKNSTTGVSANFEGKYFLELKAGTYTLIYSFLGYEKFEKKIKLTGNQYLKINIKLKRAVSSIEEVEIVADKIDRAKRIMKNVRDKRKDYLNNVKNYQCEIYVKTSFEKEYRAKDTFKIKHGDTTSVTNTISKKNHDINSYLKKDKLNLIEYIAEVYYENPDKYKESIKAFHDFSEQKPLGRSITVQAGIPDDEITPKQYSASNLYLFETENTAATFNFYKNLLDIPQLCNQPLKSPIASSSFLNYKYKYIETFTENGKKIFKLSVLPINKNAALFKGNIFIEDSTWALAAADLSINPSALMLYKNFRIIINCKQIKTGIYLPSKLNIIYTVKDGKKNILGETKIKYQNYSVNIEINKKIFNNEIKTYEKDAFEKDSVYWAKNRLLSLKPGELKFISKTDSLQRYYKSNEFLDKQDSIFNRLYWYTPIAGWGHKNHYTGTEFHIGGILEQLVPFGIGGYRHKLPLYFNKEFHNGMLLETTEAIDYGFNNKDLKGKLGIGLTYYPKKFIRTFIDVGNTYELINNYASFEQIFSRSNYVNTKSIQIRQRIEIINGLFAELTLLYSDQNPISDLQLSEWSKEIFGELNEPIDFKRYTKSELKLKLTYRINQKYLIKGNKKIIIGKDYPELFFTYRKGIPDILGSEVNFDYFEIGAKAEHQLARFGSSRWQITAGIFTNKQHLRLLEYKYFRGSDIIIFSDPLKSFQLLGPTLNTNNEFFRANYIHHFNGAILNKIPLISYLKISLAGGVGTMSIPKDRFYHFEMFAGLERVIRIKDQLFRLGIYAVTADNTLSNTNFTFKIGISPFNSYTKKWTY